MVTILAVLLAAWVTHKAGLSLALGAFMMGMSLSGSRYSMQIEAYVEPYKGILLSLFFVAVGMSIDITAITANLQDFVRYAVILPFVKVGVMFILCLFFGMNRSLAVNVSFLLAQGGEFGFVLLASARALTVIDDRTFLMGIGLISVSMLFTPVMAKLGDLMAGRFFRRAHDKAGIPLPDLGEAKGRVIIGGYGRTGHVVAILLNASRVPFIVFDNDPSRVARGKEDGLPVLYGDIANPELLVKARIEEAALVVIAVDREQTALAAISHVRNLCPGVPVLARARDLEASGRLMAAGATVALPEAVESSLHLASDTLRMIGLPVDNIDLLLTNVRRKNYELVDSGE